MNIINKLLLAAVLLGGSLTLNSCDEDVNIGSVDQGKYENVGKLDLFLKDSNSGKSENIVELRASSYQTSVYLYLTQVPMMGVDVEVKYDAAYVEQYNQTHGTSYEAFPEHLVHLDNDGKMVVAPDEKNSLSLDLTIEPATDDLKDGKTYLLPLKATSFTQGVIWGENEGYCVYLVQNYHTQSNCDKGPDAVKNFLYFEVNDTNPLNALEFVREDGKLFFDYVVLFAANINWNAETGRVYVYNNPNVQFLLDHNEEYLQPLRKRGMKVLLGILGNHDEAGVAQLSQMGCREFAKELKAICDAYNLDGVNFDDEYSEYPDLSNPWLTDYSSEAGARLLYETKLAMPDKLVTVYYLGALQSSCPSVNGVEPAKFVDIVVADYGGSASPMQGMSLKQCAGMSVELNLGRGQATEDYARRVKENGYGYYMWFALDPVKYYSYSQVSKLQRVCRGLYDMELNDPKYFYEKNDTTRYPIGG